MNIFKKVALCFISVFMFVSVGANAAVNQPVSEADKALILQFYSPNASSAAKENFVKNALQWCQAKNYVSVSECAQAMRSKIEELKLSKKSEAYTSTTEGCVTCLFDETQYFGGDVCKPSC